MAFSLKHLMSVVLVAAVGIAALTNADVPFVAELGNLFTLAIIIITGYGVWNSEGSRRAFRMGFVGWGCAYYLATKTFQFKYMLLTYPLLRIGWQLLQPSRISSLPPGIFQEAQAEWIGHFEAGGECLFALLFGLIGGWVTVCFYRKRQHMLSQ
jgi:hypothetical protein